LSGKRGNDRDEHGKHDNANPSGDTHHDSS
jgi:hypothetical protein